jgi:hypothetical protein
MRGMSVVGLIAALALSGCDKDIDGDGDGVAKSDDCNDGVATVFPGAPELCDGLDNDCNEVVDDASDNSALPFFADADGDGVGDEGTVVYGCTEPDGAASRAGDCDDADAGVYPGASEDCNGQDDDCNGIVDDAAAGEPYWRDADGDGFGGDYVTLCSAQAGFVTRAGDCDDSADDIYPGAGEACDEVDNDCDGTIDEDPEFGDTFFRDVDGDGFGDAEDQARDCVAPDGYVADFTDCDDADAGVNPGADERCDGQDQNCNGVDDEGAVDMPTWYLDADVDSYGDPDRTQDACEQPLNYVANADDCDDHDDDTSPESTEYCNGADDNCDGDVDEDTAADAPSWYPDVDLDGYGDESASKASCSKPAGYSEDDSDCDDSDATISPDASEICGTRVDENCDHSAYPCGYTGEVRMSEERGVAVSSGTWSYYAYAENLDAGDFNGDGAADLWVGWTNYSEYSGGTYNYGAAAVTYGPFTDGQSYDELVVADKGYEYMGSDLGVGDFDGDGYDDAAVTSPYYDPSGSYGYYGAVRVYEGSSAGLDLSSPSATIMGSLSYSYVGYTVDNAGDTDGDGRGELLVGANYADSSYTTGFLLYESPSGDLYPRDATGTLLSDSSGSYLYMYTSSENYVGAGRDFDGDGRDDFVFGCNDSGTTTASGYYYGKVVLVMGGFTGTTKITSAADVKVGLADVGSAGYGYVYNNVSAFEDVNGDGYDDYGYSNLYAEGYAGSYYIMPGGAALPSSLDDTSALAVISGARENEYFGGYKASSVGDVDGDRNADVMISTTSYRGDSCSGCYAALMFANPSGALSSSSSSATAVFIDDSYGGVYASPGLGLGDLDSDGYGEFALVQPFMYGSYGYGQINIFYGKGL